MKRPLGVSALSIIMTCVGSIFSFVIFIEVLDALRVGGLYAVTISSPVALAGFFLYGCLPVIFYSAGVGLYMSREWARALTVSVACPAIFFLLLNFVYNAIKTQYRLYHLNVFEFYIENPVLLIEIIAVYAVLVAPIIVYLRLPRVKRYFAEVHPVP